MFGELTFILDIDGTLCPIKQKNECYEDLVPYAEIVNRIQEYKKNGAKIILYTSRNMNSYKGNIGLINANTAKILLQWLEKWSIPYDEIIYGKPWPGQQAAWCFPMDLPYSSTACALPALFSFPDVFRLVCWRASLEVF